MLACDALDNLEGLVPAHVVALLQAPGHVTLPQSVIGVVTIPGPRAWRPGNITLWGASPGAAETSCTLTSHVTLTEQVTTPWENWKCQKKWFDFKKLNFFFLIYILTCVWIIVCVENAITIFCAKSLALDWRTDISVNFNHIVHYFWWTGAGNIAGVDKGQAILRC